ARGAHLTRVPVHHFADSFDRELPGRMDPEHDDGGRGGPRTCRHRPDLGEAPDLDPPRLPPRRRSGAAVRAPRAAHPRATMIAAALVAGAAACAVNPHVDGAPKLRQTDTLWAAARFLDSTIAEGAAPGAVIGVSSHGHHWYYGTGH